MHKLKTMTKIAFFDAHSYDRDSFNTWNKDFNYEIHYYTERLTMNTVELANGKDVVCVFVTQWPTPATTALTSRLPTAR